MKKVLIFDDFYTDSYDLDKNVNEWIETNKPEIVSITVQPLKIGYETTVNGVEYGYIWTASIVYEE